MKIKQFIIILGALVVLTTSLFSYLYVQKRPLAAQMPVLASGRDISKLHFVYSFGNGDNKEQNLKKPIDVAVDDQGRAYVLDNTDPQIKVYDPNGKFLFSFGNGNKKPEDLIAPSAVTVNNGLVLVTEPSVGRIQAFSTRGEFVRTFFSSPSDHKYSPVGIIGAEDGHVLFTDVADHRIVELDSAGTVVATFGGPGSEKGQFAYPHDIVMDENKRVYVSDSNNGRIQVFDRKGLYVMTIDGSEGGKQKMSLPRGLTIDTYNRLLVIDPLANQIRFFELTGEPLFEYGMPGEEDGQLNFPNAVAVKGKEIYIADRENHRIQVFNVAK